MKRVAQRIESFGGQRNSQQHREQSFLVMVVHLDFADIRPFTRHVVDDGVDQAYVVWADGGDDDLHAEEGGQRSEVKWSDPKFNGLAAAELSK